MREDTISRKVYRWNSTNATDELLYDFTMSIGDTLHTPHGDALVTGKDSLLTNLGYRNRWHLLGHDALGNPFVFFVVESIGSLTDPIQIICPPNYDPQWYATCFYHNGIKTYGSLCPNYLTNFQFIVNQPSCGQCNGSAMIFSTFIPDTIWWSPEYSWTPNGPSVVNGLCPFSSGTVIVTQTSTGFQYMDGYVMFGTTAPAIQNTGTVAASCATCCDGSITLNVVSGTPPYNYQWTPNVSSSDSAFNLCPGNYIVSVSDSNGCTTNDTISISFTTGVETYGTTKSNIRLYPNPVNDKGIFHVDGMEDAFILKIFDQLGREVLSKESKGSSLDFSTEGIAPGLYYFSILQDGEVQHSGKLIIE